MLELFPAKVPPPERRNSSSVGRTAGGTNSNSETGIRVGSLVKTVLPRRGVILDRAEQQCLDPEVEYICGKGMVGKVVRVAPHSLVVDLVISAADYKTIYPTPTLPKRQQQQQPAPTETSSNSPSRLHDEETSNNNPQERQLSATVGAEESHLDGESDRATLTSNPTTHTTATATVTGGKATTHNNPSESATGAIEPSAPNPDPTTDREELMEVRKTFPTNYAHLLIGTLDAERQEVIKQQFATREFHDALLSSQQWIDEIIAAEGLDLTDTSFHYQRLAGEDEQTSAGNGPSSKPLWIQKMPPSITTMVSEVGQNLGYHLRSLRRTAARHLLSWLYICCGMCKLQLGLGVTESAAVLSAGRRAALLDPTNARAYSILISTFHCTSQLDLSLQTISKCEEECPATNRANCEWLRSLLLLDSVYRLYNPKLKPAHQPRTRVPLEVTIPEIQGAPSHLGLNALQDFQPGEVIMTETPMVWLPLSTAVVAAARTPAGKTQNPLNHAASISANPMSGGGSVNAAHAPAPNLFAMIEDDPPPPQPSLLQPPEPHAPTILSATTTAEGVDGKRKSVSFNAPAAEVRQCQMCGFILAEKTSIVKTLNENNMSDLAQRFLNRYPQRSMTPCRHGQSCTKVFCSALCEEQAWETYHRIDCLEGGLLTPAHQQTLKLAGGGVSGLTDAALQLFLRVTMMVLCHVDSKMKQAGVDYNHADVSAFVAKEVDDFLGGLPIVTKLHTTAAPSVPAVDTALHVLSVIGANPSVIIRTYEPIAYAVYQHCLLSHRIVSRCPVTSVVKAKPRQSVWKEISRNFEAKMVCLFPVIGCALSPDQRQHLSKKALAGITESDRTGVSESLFSIQSEDFDDLDSGAGSSNGDIGNDGGDDVSYEDEPNVTLESTPGDLGKGFFTLRCDEKGVAAKSSIIPPLYS